jgi:DNA-binding transcriptional LysR family regulator
MRIEQLQAFLAIAETGSFQQAASACGCTQSTISRQIQSLEGDLGLALFHRHHQAKLTVGGNRLLPHARKICNEWTLVHRSIADLLMGKQPELCVAAIHSVCANILPPILQQFCHQHPHVQLRVTALGSESRTGSPKSLSRTDRNFNVITTSPHPICSGTLGRTS